MWYEDILSVGKVVAGATPLGAVLTVADALVDTEEEKEDACEMDKVMVCMLEIMAKNSDSKVDDSLVLMAKGLIGK